MLARHLLRFLEGAVTCPAAFGPAARRGTSPEPGLSGPSDRYCGTDLSEEEGSLVGHAIGLGARGEPGVVELQSCEGHDGILAGGQSLAREVHCCVVEPTFVPSVSCRNYFEPLVWVDGDVGVGVVVEDVAAAAEETAVEERRRSSPKESGSAFLEGQLENQFRRKVENPRTMQKASVLLLLLRLRR